MARRGLLTGLLVLAVGPGWANEPPMADDGVPRMLAGRFPQRVRVSDLWNRYLLEPNEAQAVLGRVAAVGRAADGKLQLVVNRGGVFGFGATPVALPLEQVAVLGEHTTLVGIAPAAFRTLPHLDPAGLEIVPADTIIEVGIVGPFH